MWITESSMNMDSFSGGWGDGIRRGTKTEMSRPLLVREATEEKQEFITEDSDQPSH